MNEDTARDNLQPWGLMGIAGIFIGLITISDYGWMAYIVTWVWVLIWASGLKFLSDRAYPEYWAAKKKITRCQETLKKCQPDQDEGRRDSC